MGSYHLQLVAPDDPIGIIYWIIPIDNSKPVVIQIVLDKLNGSQNEPVSGNSLSEPKRSCFGHGFNKDTCKYSCTQLKILDHFYRSVSDGTIAIQVLRKQQPCSVPKKGERNVNY